MQTCSYMCYVPIQGPGAVVKAAYLESRTLLWPPDFKETKVSSPLTRKDSILWGASIEFRIMCLEGSVISPSSESYPGPVQPIFAQIWPKTSFISFILNGNVEDSRAVMATQKIGNILAGMQTTALLQQPHRLQKLFLSHYQMLYAVLCSRLRCSCHIPDLS